MFCNEEYIFPVAPDVLLNICPVASVEVIAPLNAPVVADTVPPDRLVAVVAVVAVFAVMLVLQPNPVLLVQFSADPAVEHEGIVCCVMFAVLALALPRTRLAVIC